MAKLKGRQKGAVNLVGATAKENMLAVFTRLGGTHAMAEWARENQTEFYKIYGRLIPLEQHHSGAIGSYTAIPTEQRDVDTLASPTGAAANGHPPQPH